MHEALGLTYMQILDSGVAVIETMMQEYAYICHERNKAMKGEDSDSTEGDWIEIPDFDSGGMKRIKKGSL
ncbi:hypothetical protein [Bacteroides neonati]|uniref:hypothetical protein n=1 Tax=Bacteroides neonati TaxID=1347393 RepID=UPI0005A72E30|nr:hypothetical protein [Bacteroides neonati]